MVMYTGGRIEAYKAIALGFVEFRQDYRIPVDVHSPVMIVVAGFRITEWFGKLMYLRTVSWLAGDSRHQRKA